MFSWEREREPWHEIYHDGFGRWALFRQAVRAADLLPVDTCQFCGSRNGHNGLFRYGCQGDGYGARLDADNHLFCSVGCYRIYHGL